MTALLPVERLYVLSLGSRQANRHVHRHLVPLPPAKINSSPCSSLPAATSTCPTTRSRTWPGASATR
ncbi:hypothetical protein V1227_17560 [Lentzea sp. DG1S-22]|uniref:hypothetical protein n=1 Tax=Lentzea sp. DG1S-22 TaxID=3108822 RepID=UPI002E789155|nr:hypothetical protein [Lentzea sp. DG1S-22]WVH84476.1 hypothetical protein V1227_17560 [Lentzea sp. DG1S-22]